MTTFHKKLHHLIREALNEDLGDGDHSTLSCIPADQRGKAVLKIKQDGIIAGIEVLKPYLKQWNLMQSLPLIKKMVRTCF
jgi:nicotinate-nucleotide pyrophosphorylase (carboxylating)